MPAFFPLSHQGFLRRMLLRINLKPAGAVPNFVYHVVRARLIRFQLKLIVTIKLL